MCVTVYFRVRMCLFLCALAFPYPRQNMKVDVKEEKIEVDGTSELLEGGRVARGRGNQPPPPRTLRGLAGHDQGERAAWASLGGGEECIG